MSTTTSARYLSRLLLGLAVVLSVVLAGCGQTPATTVAPTEAPVEATSPPAATAESLEEIQLEMWWWGCQNAPEYEDYIERTIALYEESHPNITIEQVCRGTDDTLSAFQGAVAANQGPDIATEWYGLYMMPDVWAGNILPLSQYLPEEETGHWSDAWQSSWNGDIWAFGQFAESHPIIYNKKMFTAAGLDPNSPPETWDEFVGACVALKDADIEPIVIGLKDGWIVPPLLSVFAYQDLKEGPLAYLAAVAGERSFTEPEFVGFFDRLSQLKEQGCFNADASSLGTYDGRESFAAGRGALNFPAGSTALGWYQSMGSDVVGIMMPPKTAYPMTLDASSETVFLTGFAEHPQEAAEFLAFFRTPERLKALNDELGNLYVPDDRFDLNWVQDPVIKGLFEGMAAGNDAFNMSADAMIPYSILADGFFPAVQLMFSENLGPEDAAAMVQTAAENWRTLNPEMLKDFQGWYETIRALSE